MKTRLMKCALALCLATTVAVSSGCGGGESRSGRVGKKAPAPTAPDGSRTAYATALEAVTKEAPDAVLASAGTLGVSQTTVPNAWSFYFISPESKEVYQVVVDHGETQPVDELGDAETDVDYSSAVQFESIRVAAAEAVEKARAYGQQSGDLPPHVLVNGAFLDVPGAEDLGATLGSWTVTFTRGTDLTGSRAFTVTMSTGEVTEIK